MSEFEIVPANIDAVKQIVAAKRLYRFFKSRHERNVANPPRQFSKDAFWRRMVVCICTSVQKSGPSSRVSKFVRERPFPLNLGVCEEKENLRSFAEEILRSRGLRFGPTIAQRIELNLRWLCNDGWPKVQEQFAKLCGLSQDTSPEARIAEEREAARLIMGRNGGLAGFGSKQARNLWQWMGVTQYEIPLDSRVCDWLNALPSGFGIASNRLYSSVSYYEATMSKVQALCKAAGVLPCEFDAAVFSNADAEEWPEEDDVF